MLIYKSDLTNWGNSKKELPPKQFSHEVPLLLSWNMLKRKQNASPVSEVISPEFYAVMLHAWLVRPSHATPL